MKGDKGSCILKLNPQFQFQLRRPNLCILSSWGEILITLATEFAGTLLGFDDYVNMVLEDVIEL
jgi:LSM domain